MTKKAKDATDSDPIERKQYFITSADRSPEGVKAREQQKADRAAIARGTGDAGKDGPCSGCGERF